jgi:hypothetical protein
MSGEQRRRYRAGDRLDDLCRACKLVRVHSVFAAGPDGAPIRVVCDYCGSQHNYRGGGAKATRSGVSSPRGEAQSAPLALVSERERSGSPVSIDETNAGGTDLELLLRRIIREETGLTPVAPAAKWRGGELVLRPGKPGVQEKSWPVETLFQKVIAVRNRLRVLEQQINGAELPADLKLKLQGYITGCYGSLTSFNVLFAEDQDRFKGGGGKG